MGKLLEIRETKHPPHPKAQVREALKLVISILISFFFGRNNLDPYFSQAQKSVVARCRGNEESARPGTAATNRDRMEFRREGEG